MDRMGLLLFSVIGVAVLVVAARLLGFSRTPRVPSAELAARLASDALAGFTPTETAISRDGSGALVVAQDGRVALVRPLGDRFVVRPLTSPIVGRAGSVLRVRPDEAMFPETSLDLGEAAALHWAGRL